MYLELAVDKDGRAEIAVEACQCPLNEIRKVYEQYKHMDKIICDSHLNDRSFEYTIMVNFWQAIKASVEPPESEQDRSDHDI